MIYYILIINIVGFLACAVDKIKAKTHAYRISEKKLIFINIIGGCFGFFIGMILFRHKIRKAKFYIVVPILTLLWGLFMSFY